MLFLDKKYEFLLFLFFSLCGLNIGTAQEVTPDSIDQQIDSLNDLGVKLRSRMPDSAYTLASAALELSQKHQRLEKEGDCYRVLGLAARYSGDFTKALEWQNKAMTVFETLRDTSKIAATYVNLGNIVRRQGQLTQAFEYQLTALRLLQAAKASPMRIAVSYNNIGNIYREMEAFDEALDFHQKALQVRLEEKDTNTIIQSYNNIGIIYYSKTAYDTAAIYYDKALQLATIKDVPNQIAKANVSLGNINYKLKKYELAEYHYKNALDLHLQGGDKYSIYSALNNLGLAYTGMKQYPKAIQYYKEALATAEAANLPKMRGETYENMATAQYQMGDYKSAYDNFVRYKTISDTLLNSTTMDRMAELRADFETEQKEQEIALLQARERIRVIQRRWMLAGLIALGVLAIIAGRAWWLRKKAVQKLERQKAEMTQLLREKETLLEDLSKAQSQLIASEKMASLGQLTAGIAHEINNPINFITSSLEALKLDFKDLQQLLLALFDIKNSSDTAQIEKVLKLASELDSVYTTQEMAQLIGSIERGTHRTQEIVKNLRTFSRDTSEEFLLADIHEGLDSTILILEHKLKDRIQLDRQYSILPLIPCQISRLNQVFLNLLDNAIQAIEEEGQIWVSTKRLEHTVEICIQDTGTGMDDHTQKHLFEPFFTTKSVGEGTGLGLSISYSIIKQHQGRIDIESALGKGTTFTISLPIDKIQVT